LLGVLLLAGHRWWLLGYGLGLFDEDGPVFGYGKFAVEGGCMRVSMMLSLTGFL